MVIKYSRLSGGGLGTSGDNFVNISKWAKSRLPVAFLRQQLFLVSIVLASLLLFIFTKLFTTNIEDELTQNLAADFNYGVIVDCGSSGSRAHIFKWRNSPGINRIEFVRDATNGIALNKHITPGLSSLRDDPDKASDYMEPIMKFISDSIPSERHIDTPVYFLATAGLRLLDYITQKKILSDINRDLKAKFSFPKLKSQVISGSFEGVYSWLSLNMNRKVYDNSQNSKSYGMIELGGASAQVTFELNPDIENAILKDLKDVEAISAFRNERISLNLGSDKPVELFATTFLGLGVNSAREAAIDLLVRDYLNGTSAETESNNFEARLKDPCLTTGSSEIVLRPKALLHDKDHHIGFMIKNQEDTFKVRLEGTGNFLNCINLLERVLQILKAQKLNCLPSKPCSMALLGTEFIPYLHYQFIGLSEMFFTTNEMLNSAGNFNRSRILHETQRVCSTQYNRLKEMYSPNAVSFEDRILYECFKASWLLTILHSSGFNMPATYDNFKTVDRLDGHEIDWTMGAMIKEVALNKVNKNNLD